MEIFGIVGAVKTLLFIYGRYIPKYGITEYMRKIIVCLLRFYQLAISPFFSGNCCRFEPSCSQYALDAIQKDGVLKGLLKTICRILKCNPFHPGGSDPA